MSILTITEKNQINTEGITVLKFYADWCPPCQQYAPIFEEFVNSNKNLANFGQINIDNARDIAVEYKVMSIPTTVILKNGVVVESKNGVINPNDLLTIINNAK